MQVSNDTPTPSSSVPHLTTSEVRQSALGVNQPNRDLSLDVMRGLSIVSMVEIHSLIHFPPSQDAFRYAMGSFGTLAAPFFLMCAGMGVGYLQVKYGSNRTGLRSVLFRRGIFLVVFAALLGVFRLDPRHLIDWDIFTLIGFMYAIIAALGGLDWRGVLVGIAVVTVSNLILPMDAPGILRGGSFPIVPFGFYFLIGLGLVPLRSQMRRRALTLALIGLSGTIVVVAAIWRADHLLHVTRFDVWSSAGMLVITSVFCGLWGTMLMAEAVWSGFPHAVMPLVRLGRLSFSLYYVQYFFLFLLPKGIGLILHRNISLVLPNLFWVASLLFFLCWLYMIVVVWAHFDFKLSLEWFMSTYVSPRSMFVRPHPLAFGNSTENLKGEVNERS